MLASGSCQLPIDNCQLPIDNCQLPIDNCQLPLFLYRNVVFFSVCFHKLFFGRAHMLVCPTRGAMKCGCALRFGHILVRGSSKTSKTKKNTQGGARARSARPLGAPPRAVLDVFNGALDFLAKMWPKRRAHPHFIAPRVGHTSIWFDFLLNGLTFLPACTPYIVIKASTRY